MNNVLELEANERGRDILVGDIHGCFGLLKNELKKIGFDRSIDRLICTGDLIDKGPASHRAVEWLEQPWFFSVMGNHEAPYAFGGQEHLFKCDLICLPFDSWMFKIDPSRTEEIIKELGDAYLRLMHPAITVQTRLGPVGVIHASIPPRATWADTCQRINDRDYNFFHLCMVDRSVAAVASKPHTEQVAEAYRVPDLAHLFHGHSWLEEQYYRHYHIANRYHIDTAACRSLCGNEYPGSRLTLFDICDPSKPIN